MTACECENQSYLDLNFFQKLKINPIKMWYLGGAL